MATAVFRPRAVACASASALLLSAALLLAGPVPRSALAAETPTANAALAAVIDPLAGWTLAHGRAVGLAVTVVLGEDKPVILTYGTAKLATGRRAAVPVGPDTIFSLGSNTKVLTTNVLAQWVAEDLISLDDDLADFSAAVGPLGGAVQGALKQQITIGEMAIFTSGLLDVPPTCRNDQQPAQTGCMPPAGAFRPGLKAYGAADFLTLLRQTRLRNWQADPPPPVTSLPAPYNYSNTSNALVGLILGTPAGQPITDKSVNGWFEEVRTRVLKPLGMASTFLAVPADARPRVANGYSPAFGAAEVTGGAITGFTLQNAGASYPPGPVAVTIEGGGGSGAVLSAQAGPDHTIASVTVTAGGSGYQLGPRLLRDGVPVPDAPVIVENGRVVAVVLRDPIAVGATPPRFSIDGGQTDVGGTQARVVGRVFAGAVRAIAVVEGGSGYVAWPVVRFAPSQPQHQRVAIVAPAGFLKSSIRDMSRFTQAAMLARRTGGAKVPKPIRDAFRLAQTPFACEAGPPALQNCPSGRAQAGLGWQVFPRDGGKPRVLAKDGGIAGFTTQTLVSPEMGLGVMVMASSQQSSGVATATAEAIFYALYFRCLRGDPLCPQKK
ncbi:serine hydrolase [Pseudoxanthobacter sp. M-2]|uniref:serine hydrolase domain-containing protein n=1 Tax=Pseudoxanthobacter sp. M-2 TaxID=3078754 RepID=UPI0038FCCF98